MPHNVTWATTLESCSSQLQSYILFIGMYSAYEHEVKTYSGPRTIMVATS
jgi:hypothetical protein